MVFDLSFFYRTALHCAAHKCKVEILDALIHTGQLHPNQQDNEIKMKTFHGIYIYFKFNDTALHIAVNNRNVDAINFFLGLPGIKFNIRNNGGIQLFFLIAPLLI